MKNGFQIMDSDFHVMEPNDLWERYLEEEWKPQAPKFVQNPRFPASSPGIVVQSKAIPAAKNDEMAVRTRSDLHMRMRARSFCTFSHDLRFHVSKAREACGLLLLDHECVLAHGYNAGVRCTCT